MREAWLPGLLVALGAAELASLGTPGWLASIGIESVAGLLLVLRRRLPMVVVPLSAAALTLIPLTGTGMDQAAAPILFYILGMFSLGRWLTLPRGLVLLAFALAIVFWQVLVLDPRPQDWTDVVFVLSLAMPPFVFGRIVRRLDEQSVQLAEQQSVIADQAVQAERDRIARELHDVIAHTISAMVVQTAAAQDLLRTRPDRAAELLDSVAETGRAALGEVGRLLHLVRDDAADLGLAPAPSTADLPELVDSFRQRGLDVRAELDLSPAALPSAVDVSTYRMVQEALTNALKHGRGPISLSLVATRDCLRLNCSNARGTPSADGSGLGLRGMAERVDLLGGSMSSGHDDRGDFLLEVAIPLDGSTR